METIHNLCQQLKLSTKTELKAKEYRNIIENNNDGRIIEKSKNIVSVYTAIMLSTNTNDFRSLVEIAKNINISIPILDAGYRTVLYILKTKSRNEQIKKFMELANQRTKARNEQIKKFMELANQGKTQKEIAVLYGITRKIVWYRFKKYGIIPARKIKSNRLKEEIKILHLQKYSDNNSAKKLGISHQSVGRIRKKMKLSANFPKGWSNSSDVLSVIEKK